jgi:hypothetical protein
MSAPVAEVIAFEHKAPPPSFPVATDSPQKVRPRKDSSGSLKSKGMSSHPSHNFSLNDDNGGGVGGLDLSPLDTGTGTPPSEPSIDSGSTASTITGARKKSVRFGADDANPSPTAAAGGGSRNGSITGLTPRKNSGAVSPRSVLKRSADAEEIRKFTKKMSQIGLLLERLKKGDTLTKYYE